MNPVDIQETEGACKVCGAHLEPIEMGTALTPDGPRKLFKCVSNDKKHAIDGMKNSTYFVKGK